MKTAIRTYRQRRCRGCRQKFVPLKYTLPGRTPYYCSHHCRPNGAQRPGRYRQPPPSAPPISDAEVLRRLAALDAAAAAARAERRGGLQTVDLAGSYGGAP